ncbi:MULTISPECIES: hypothetical protein [Nitrosomonas]|uniref:Uncharacterized protein n=1 Tax=Nitrosomonas communis TaxID=44574 RepID=A0A0F7KCQ9_9PROT|nr:MULTISPECIES: hypothetical protein [Nitrosomonas]AKH38305.1 hypothetical protein AAW31_11695 [Nitrosomonas communis]UVS60302.1 hypothetical protein NX761_12370 [Nitrosomonas sp. PLL12]
MLHIRAINAANLNERKKEIMTSRFHAGSRPNPLHGFALLHAPHCKAFDSPLRKKPEIHDKLGKHENHMREKMKQGNHTAATGSANPWSREIPDN